MPLRPCGRLDGQGIVAGMKVRLHLSDTVQPLGKRRVRISGEPGVAELFIVEGAKFPRQAAQRPDEFDMRLDDGNDVYQLRLLRKSETTLDLALHLAERISRCQKILDQIQAAVPPHKHEVADLVRDFESAMQEIARGPDVLRIWDQEMREQHIGPGLETLQPASFHQLAPDLTEARSGLVIAESVTRDEAKPDIDVARTVAVTTLEGEIHCPAYGQGMKIRFHKGECSWRNLRQHVNRREGCRISHQGQLEHILDRNSPESPPDPIVFTPHILVGRVRRPFNAQISQVVETDGNRAAAL